MSLSSDIVIDTEEKPWNRMNISSDNNPKSSLLKPNTFSMMKLMTMASWIVNWFLLIVKIVVVILSSSKAVTAALADSAVDLVSQGVLSLAEAYMSKHSPEYPVGRSRLEALSVLGCAFIMSMASVEIIQFSIIDLIDGFSGDLPILDLTVVTYVILAIGTALKLVLFICCRWVNLTQKSDILEALAEDHLNDVFSNTAAIVAASIAFNIRKVWWVDPIGAIAISVVIIVRWFAVMLEQVKKIVGYTAPKEFIESVEEIARNHDHRLRVDCTRAYHFGARYNVEMEIVLPGDMSVAVSHDIALSLQHRIEGLDEVERAFVHVDHQIRDGLEHKIERELVLRNRLMNKSSSDSASPIPIPHHDIVVSI